MKESKCYGKIGNLEKHNQNLPFLFFIARQKKITNDYTETRKATRQNRNKHNFCLSAQCNQSNEQPTSAIPCPGVAHARRPTPTPGRRGKTKPGGPHSRRRPRQRPSVVKGGTLTTKATKGLRRRRRRGRCSAAERLPRHCPSVDLLRRDRSTRWLQPRVHHLSVFLLPHAEGRGSSDEHEDNTRPLLRLSAR